MRLRHKKNAEIEIFTSPLVINVDTNDVAVANAYRSGDLHCRNKHCEPDCRGEHCEPHYEGELYQPYCRGEQCEPVAKNLLANQIASKSIFGNSNPLHLELGMGKGKFVIELAKLNPEINYIGIEKSATIVMKAISNMENITKNSSSHISNLRFMCIDIENLSSIFMQQSVDKIYLNFSDPWPKKRHEVRRLTHIRFLSQYEKILKKGSILEFKTDNKDLFDFSIEQIKNSNFKLLEYTYDLHNDKKLNEGNIMTEYEEKFSKLGNKICKFIAQI